MNDMNNKTPNDDNNANGLDAERGNELDPIARLSAADPAANVEPRDGFVAETVARALAASAATPESAEASAGAHAGAEAPAETPTAAVTDLGAERARRRPRWLAYAAVAASVAIVGGAGFGLGTATNNSFNVASGAAPAISLQSGAGQTPPQQEGALQGFAGAAASQGKLAADSMFAGFGRNVFTSSGLSKTTGTAQGYTFDSRAVSNAETVSALAAALGVKGEPVLKDGSWSVGPQDGVTPSLTVGLDGMMTFSFSDPTINPWTCGVNIMPVEPDAGAGANGMTTLPATPMEPCLPPASLPSEQAAIDALTSLITAVGRDASAFEFTSETWEGSFTRSAQAWPVVDGQRVDQSWSIELTDAGVYSLYGALAPIVPLGDYPIVSEQQAFERLADPRFGAQMGVMPYAMREMAIDPGVEWVAPTEPPATPSQGASISWPVNTVEIVSARLGLTSQWQPDGSVLIVPAYEFTDAAGGTWSVIAVADSKLDFATK